MNPLPPPGPELDRLIAEKVMGWKIGGAFGETYWLDHASKRAHPISWSPSTSIDDAMEVLMKFPYWHLFHAKSDPLKFEVYVCRILVGNEYAPQGEAKTIPHCICLAALSAQEKGAGS